MDHLVWAGDTPGIGPEGTVELRLELREDGRVTSSITARLQVWFDFEAACWVAKAERWTATGGTKLESVTNWLKTRASPATDAGSAYVFWR